MNAEGDSMSRRLLGLSGDLRGRIALVGVALIAGNLLAWLWAFFAFRDHRLLMGTALLAYGFGLRHAVDADHIAAIDNVTRKLMHEGGRPVTVGLYFSLGHSTIVTALTLLVAVAASVVEGRFERLQVMGGLIGTSVSAFFLFAIAVANLVILADTWRSFRDARDGLLKKDAQSLLPVGGVTAKLFRGLFHLIDHSWQMYGLGLLFGLGFDTATQVGLLAVSAAGASNGLSPWAIMVFPALFCAGMALIDTADGILMLGAYGWAFIKPIRKLYYNLTITSISVLVAVLIGCIEILGLIDGYLKPLGAFWTLVGDVNGNFELLGYGIIGLFVLGWLVSLVIYKVRRYEAD
jgi:nickel/cobalt transporter (NiCoT) family protein